jgi:hypothetical protein
MLIQLSTLRHFPDNTSCCLVPLNYISTITMVNFRTVTSDYHTSNIIALQEKYEEATVALAEMEKRAVMAESMLEATLQYQSGQTKLQPSPRYVSSA